jgi:K+-sensing histidine kinase KdpD
MKRKGDSRVWMLVGVFGSMALGIVLIPLRSVTSASNLAFVFLAFTIIVAELGGRGAALVTALVSAMSLNFCLTEPYLALSISKRDDVIAFFALAGCGLIAAAFGKQRRSLSDIAGRAGEELDILKRLVEQLENKTPLDEILRDIKNSFRLSTIVLRDASENILSVAPPGSKPSVPKTQLTSETLFPPDETRYRFGVKGLRLPEGGGRLSLQTDRGPVSLDLWEGDPQGIGVDESRTLALAALILMFELSRRQAGNKLG